MAKSRIKNNKKPIRKKTKPGKKSNRLISAGFLASAGIITVLTFISLEAAMLCFGLSALALYVFYSNKQHSFWEQASSFKFKTLKKSQESLLREIYRNRDELDRLKEEIKSTARNIKVIQEQEEEASLAASMSGFRTKAVRPKSYSELKTRSTQALQTPAGKAPIVANEYSQADYESLSDIVVREIIYNAIKKQQIDVFVQPVVRLPQRQTRFFELYARVRAKPGMYIPAARYMKLAQEDKSINKIDHLLLIECIKAIKNSALSTNAAPFFINITSGTITNPGFMKKLLEFISKNRSLAPRLIFEIQQDDFENMHPAVLEILRGLSKIGCSLSIDNVKTLNFDIKFLQVLKVRFVKINASDLLPHINNPKQFAEMQRLKRKLEGNGIGFIVEKIENENELRELLDYNINYGQGHLFGRPDLQTAYQERRKIA